MIEPHTLQLMLTTYFIFMLGITSDSKTTASMRRFIRYFNVFLVLFVAVNIIKK